MSDTTAEVIDPKLAKALAHPLRVRLLARLHERVASPTELSRDLSERLGNVSYHIKVLLEVGCIELVKEEQRRGAIEHFYRAVQRPFFSAPDWMALPTSTQHDISSAVLEMIGQDAREALATGTFTEREDTHLSRTPMLVDEQGWREVTALLAETLNGLLEIEAQASNRLAASGEEGMFSRVAMMHFKSPGPSPV
ncbi:MAG TPA: helix-turn-helix domain-containing protein [Solirubrobacterales bacterium]|nr:helix-turn-helix domain-containing protein [Solirubrobacterales bacterium]